MDVRTARQLCMLNTRFYAENAASFSATRSKPWDGWHRLLDLVDGQEGALGDGSRVLDIACGNARFVRFLEQRYPMSGLRYVGIDNCPALSCDEEALDVRCVDILQGLLDEADGNPLEAAGVGKADLVTCFGFLHHLPGEDLRTRLLRCMASVLEPKGFLAVTFWRFAEDAVAREKAIRSTRDACDELGLNAECLDSGDYILGWQGLDHARRYCHSFSSDEIEALNEDLCTRFTVKLVGIFQADGANGRSNCYAVWQR